MTARTPVSVGRTLLRHLACPTQSGYLHLAGGVDGHGSAWSSGIRGTSRLAVDSSRSEMKSLVDGLIARPTELSRA